MLAKAVAREAKSTFIGVNVPEFIYLSYGTSRDEVDAKDFALYKVISKACAFKPSVLYFDELDSIGHGRLFSQLVSKLDDLRRVNDVIVIGATIRPDLIPTTLIGRFDSLIYVPMPDCAARLEILKMALRNAPVSQDVDWEHIAFATDKYTGSDLVALCRRATQYAVREAIKNSSQGNSSSKTYSRAIAPKHFEQAVVNFRAHHTDDNNLLKYVHFSQMIHATTGETGRFKLQTSDATNNYDEDEDLYA